MVTTDAMSRGLDIPDITSVIHAPFPTLARDFLHRSGRVGRAGRSGRVAVFYSEKDRLALKTRELVEKNEPLDALFSLKHIKPRTVGGCCVGAEAVAGWAAKWVGWCMNWWEASERVSVWCWLGSFCGETGVLESCIFSKRRARREAHIGSTLYIIGWCSCLARGAGSCSCGGSSRYRISRTSSALAVQKEGTNA